MDCVERMTRHIVDSGIKEKVCKRLTDFLDILDKIDGGGERHVLPPENYPTITRNDLEKREEIRLKNIIVEDLTPNDATVMSKPIELAVNIRGQYGHTPLITAVLNNDKGEVLSLLAQGADPNIGDHYGMTAYDKALNNGFDEIAAILRPYIPDEGEGGDLEMPTTE